MDKKASGKALLPFGIFVGVYLATGMILNFQGVVYEKMLHFPITPKSIKG